MTEFPGVLPWHFGGDETLTWDEAQAFFDTFNARIKAREEQERQMKSKKK